MSRVLPDRAAIGTLVYGALAAFIGGVYLLIVVVIGSAGAGGGLAPSGSRASLVLSIVATAIVAVAFQPARERLVRLANRLVYGQRATPYELLSTFSAQMGDAYAAEDLLPRLARLLAEGTAASRADVWLRHGQELRPVTSWPSDAVPPGLVLLDEHAALAVADRDRVELVRHQGQVLGAVSVSTRRDEPLTPAQDRLVGEFAAHAGLVLRYVGLTGELVARLDELTASRQRIVQAQDLERHRIQRDIEGGAERQLEALHAKFGAARAAAGAEPEPQRTLIAELRADIAATIESLRELARGIYPPLLADQGLVAAVRAQAAKAGGPVTLDADDVGRLGRDVEAAVYFCCVEALRNVGRHAGSAPARIRLARDDGRVTFEVTDEGPGFDVRLASSGTGLQHMADRLAALGGAIRIDSRPGEGTTVAGEIPLRT
jgi:signal transduction histidine kinase